MGRRKARIAFVLSTLVAGVVGPAPAAWAACHRFDLSVAAASIDEGDTVTVTVTRDGSVDDSSVRVATADGSAQAGSDYEALDRRIDFTGSSLEQSVTISTVVDDRAEPAEDFVVGLSDPGGCAVNPNFSLAADVTVTIAASQGPAAGDESPEPTPTESPSPAPTQAESPEEPQDDATPEGVEDDSDDDGGGLGTGLLVAALVVLVAAGGFLAMRKRSGT